MNAATWIGLGVGVIIGLMAGMWQTWDMRLGPAAIPGLRRMASSVLRMFFVVVALLLAWRWTGADRLWTVGSAATVYTLVFVWTLKKQLAKKK